MSALDERELITNLHLAAIIGDLLSLLTLLEDPRADVVSADDHGRTLLHSACETGQLEIIKALLSGEDLEEAPVDAQDHDGKTPLMLAVENRHHNVVNDLLERAGAGLVHVDKLGESAMIFASNNGDVEMMELLEQYGAEIHDSNNKGVTTLHYACMKDQSDAVMFLLKKGAPLNKLDFNGDTALHVSLEAKSSCAGILLAGGANTTIVNNKNESPLDIAKRVGDTYHASIIEAMQKRESKEGAGKAESRHYLFQIRDKLTQIEPLINIKDELTKKYELQVHKDMNAAATEKNLEMALIRSRLLRLAVTDSDIENIRNILTRID